MKKNLKALSSLVVLVLVVSIFLSGFSFNAKKEDTKDVTLSFGITSDIVSLDPAFAYDSNTAPVVDQITEGLLAYDANNKLIPKIAKDWKIVDSKTYLYNVKSNIKFSDGTPLTIEDVLFSLNRTKDPATASSEGWMYANVASIKQTGPWQITVKLKKADATFKYVFATTGGHIISKKYYDLHKDKFGKPDGGVLGTGPYVFKKWVTGSEIDLEKNQNYWDNPNKIAVNKIAFKIIPETSTLLRAVKTGQVDVTMLSSDTIDQAKAFTNVNTVLNEGYQATEISFNNSRAPFNDVYVRRAVASAIDAASINKKITKYDVPANALPFGIKVASYNTATWENFGKTAPYYKYDMKQAKALLAKSKYPKGFNCDIVINSGSSSINTIALVLQQSLKELNINLSIKKYPFNDFISYAYGSKLDKDKKRDYDIIAWSWLSDWPDPAGYMIPLYSSSNIGQGGANYAAYSNPTVDKLLDQQNQLLDNTKRTQLLLKAISIANSDAAYSVISYPKDIFTINKRFTYNPSASWFYNFAIKDFKVN